MNEKEYLERLNFLWEKNKPLNLPQETNYAFGETLITEYLSKRAALTPDKPCIIYYGTEFTYSMLDDLSNRFASFLASSGLEKGDRVAVFMPNCPQFHIAFYGILKLGCVHVPVNPMFKEEELIYELQDTQAKVIVTTDQLNAMIQKVKSKTNIQRVVTTSLKDYLPKTPLLPVHSMYLEPRKDCFGTIDMLSELKRQTPLYPDVEVSLDDIASLNYTGGTTGLPKGCVHTQRNMLYASATTCTYNLFLNPEKIALVYWPSFWIAGQVFCLLNPVVSGATHILLGRWDPEATLKALEKYKVNLMIGLVDEYVELMSREDIEKYDFSSIEVALATSFTKKLNLEYRKRWENLTNTVMREAAYGMTETHTVDTYTSFMQSDDMDLKSRPVFVGLPMHGTQFKITDFETGELVPLGEEGEIMIKSPSLFKQYWNKPEETKKAFDNGWFHSGDMGMLDEEGYLHYLGRNKEMLKVNGMSVFPQEIEILLSRYPAIAASGVVGMEHEEKGEVPVAFIQLNNEYIGKVNETEILNWCKKNMAVYKVPIVKIIDKLPMTTTGKVFKVELQKNLQLYFKEIES